MSSSGGVSPGSALSDEAMMALVCARNDGVLFGELVVRWQQQIRSVCLRMTGNPQDADDLTQETFCRAYAARNQFRGHSAFSTWLWRIAINAVRDRHRRVRPVVTGEPALADLPSAIPDPDELARTSETVECVARAVRQLPDELRTIVVLRHYQGLKFREISDVLDLPVGTVCSRMAEGLNRLAGSLQGLADP